MGTYGRFLGNTKATKYEIFTNHGMHHEDFNGKPGACHKKLTMKYGLDVQIETTFFEVWLSQCDKLKPIEEAATLAKQIPVQKVKKVKITYNGDTESNPLFYDDNIQVRKYVKMTKKAAEIQEEENTKLIQHDWRLQSKSARIRYYKTGIKAKGRLFLDSRVVVFLD